MSFLVSKFRVHGNLRIYVTTAEHYYKMQSFALGKKWRIIDSEKERDKTVYQCEQIHKKYFGPMEEDNEERANYRE